MSLGIRNIDLRKLQEKKVLRQDVLLEVVGEFLSALHVVTDFVSSRQRNH